jgi:hypothetical protein
MRTYLITNRSPKNYVGTPEALAAWSAWFDQLGDNLVDRGNPAFVRAQLGDCGPNTELGGYTLVSAENLAAALALAAECPMLAAGGGVEVGELTLLNSGRRQLG